jgi:hypothetical protein
MSGSIVGNLTSSGGPVTSESLNVNFSFSGTAYSYTGTVTCNGTSFDVSTLGLH